MCTLECTKNYREKLQSETEKSTEKTLSRFGGGDTVYKQVKRQHKEKTYSSGTIKVILLQLLGNAVNSKY